MACYRRPVAAVPLVYVVVAGSGYTVGTSEGTVLVTGDEADRGPFAADPFALAVTIADPVEVDLRLADVPAPPVFVMPPTARP